MDYGTAGYCAEQHPDDPSDPVPALWVEMRYCKRCGAIVHDTGAHDNYHRFDDLAFLAFGGCQPDVS